MSGGEAGEERVFVYGTLRRGRGGEGLLAGSRWLGEAELAGELHDLGAYPAVVPGGSGRVRGELWICGAETLRELDAYEGVAEGLFERVRVEVGGEACWVYQAGPLLRSRLGPSTRVWEGEWEGAEGRGGG